jgi:hypothetical protein
LKTQLYTIIKGHTDNGYGGLYTIYQTSDVDNFYENDGTVLDMYSENQTEPILIIIQQGLHNDVVTILEGIATTENISQSTFGSAAPMVSDAHFITPADGKVNRLP